MATQVASLFGVLDLRDNLTPGLSTAKTNLTGFGSHLTSIGGQVKDFGQKLTVAMLPVAAAMGLSIKAAVDFDESMTNVAAVMGLTADEQKNLTDQILKFGGQTRAGPQAVADAFYDIVGGVADASTHMAILEASVKTAEAGSADLGGTTKALISVMNAYKFSAKDAGLVSDVLTRTVGMGVGTMDEFAAALPNVTGLSHSLGISFSDVGTMMAYLTTQGNSASESATQLSGMMTSMLNPNETMKTALKELGFETGQAAIESLGLLGAFEQLRGTSTAQSKGMAELVGRVEALRGVTSFAGEDVRDFFGKFRGGLQGATEDARNIQMTSAAAQFDLLKSSVSALGITIGTALLPMLLDIANDLKPVVQDIISWIEKNPEATKTILMVAAGLVILGPIIGIASTATGLLTSGLGLLKSAALFLLTPLGAVTLAVTALIGVYLQLKAISDQYWAVEKERQAFYARGGTVQQAQQITGQSVANQIAASRAQGRGGEAAAIGFINALGGFGDTGQKGGGLGTQLGTGKNIFETLMAGVSAYTGRDFGGPGAAGSRYGIGVPEMWEGAGGSKIFFSPREGGQFTPTGGGMGGMSIGNINVYANDAAGGAAAGEAFKAKLDQIYKQRGN